MVHLLRRNELLRPTLFQIKLIHTLIFFLLSFCVVFALLSAIANDITLWTWVAIGAIAVEGLILAISGRRCPLTILAERQGVQHGSVSDIFLPSWFADRIFPICSALYLIALVLVALRLLE